jgi:putative ATPase
MRRKAASGSLFPQKKPAAQPLADRIRPASLDEVVGQEHLLGPGKLLS